MRKLIQKFLLLSCLFFPLTTRPMFNLSPDNPDAWVEQPKSLQETCIKKMSTTLLAMQSYDMETEEKKLRETLERLPEQLQQAVVDEIDIHLDPTWTKKTWYKKQYSRCPERFSTLKNFSIIKNLAVYYLKDTIYINDFESDPAITIGIPRHAPIKNISLTPDATLLAVQSPTSIDIFTLKLPIRRLTTIPITPSQNITSLTLSGSEEPKLFTAANGTLSIFSDLCKDNFTRKEYPIPQAIKMRSLVVSPNNHYLVASSRFERQSSFVVNLENDKPIFQPISLPIYRPRIAQDSSFFVARLVTPKDSPSASIIFKKSGRTHLISGRVQAIKNNYIFTILRTDTINIFNPEGMLQHAYTITNSLNPAANNAFCFYSFDYQRLHMPESLTNQDLKKLIYKIAHTKARKQENLSILRALSQEPSIALLAAKSIREIKRYHRSVIKALKNAKRGKRSKYSVEFILGTAAATQSQHKLSPWQDKQNTEE